MFRIIIYSIALLYILTGNDHQYPKAWDELQSNEGWELIKETDRVKVFSKEISASPLPAHRTEMISSIDMQTLIKNRWKLFSGKDLTIIAQLTAWINFLFPAYLGLFLILVFGIHNFNLSELQIALWLGCVPFLLYILGKFILLYGKPFTISDLIKTLGVHLYLNFQSSFVWIPSLLGIKKPFCKTPKQEHTQRKRMLTCTSFIFILFFAMASIALYFQMLTLSLVYTSLGMIYGASTYFTLNMFKTSPELEKLNLQTYI